MTYLLHTGFRDGLQINSGMGIQTGVPNMLRLLGGAYNISSFFGMAQEFS